MQVEAFIEQDPAILGVFDSLDSPEVETYLAVAGRLSDDYDFAHTTLSSFAGKYGKAPTVKIFKKSEGKEVGYSGKFEQAEVYKWIENNAVPLLIDLDE